MKAPFPWFGGKSRVADLVWNAFGDDVRIYTEPFFGSGAVLLGRPRVEGKEQVNDLDGFVSNFWRALRDAPDEVARWADYPVIENDLHARHAWLLERKATLRDQLQDPDWFDAKIAGWWVWGINSWIGSGWCSILSKQMPSVGNSGSGVHRKNVSLQPWFRHLADRLRRVRVLCGDWSRIVTDAVTRPNTVTVGVGAVFLDPPYSHDLRNSSLYNEESNVSADVRKWCLENGCRSDLRIALCGYEGEHELPGWRVVEWKANGGYGSQSNNRARDNAKRERIWFSPSCINTSQGVLFCST